MASPVDLGVILKAPTEDPLWLKKCALFGLLTLLVSITLVGLIPAMLNALGWMRAYAEARIRGEKQLPDVSFGYMGGGFRVFVALLPVIGVMLVVIVVIGGIGAIGAA